MGLKLCVILHLSDLFLTWNVSLGVLEKILRFQIVLQHSKVWEWLVQNANMHEITWL